MTSDATKKTMELDMEEDMGPHEALRPFFEFASEAFGLSPGEPFNARIKKLGDVVTMRFTNGEGSMSISMAPGTGLYDDGN